MTCKEGVEAASVNGARRKKLWELDTSFHCPIVGTCLTIAELRRLHRKAGKFTQQPCLTDYDAHVAFVSAASQPMHATKLLQKTLDKKFQVAIKQFSKAKHSDELSRLWDEAVANGAIAGPFWAVLTHPASSEELIHSVYGEVHMLSHLAGASTRADLRRLTFLEKRSAELKEAQQKANARAARQVAEHREIIQSLNRRLARALEAERQLKKLRERLSMLESGQELKALKKQNNGLLKKLARETERADEAEQGILEWSRLAKEAQERFANLQAELDSRPPHATRADSLPNDAHASDQSCPPGCGADAQLSGRCILYVGGRSKLTPHLRALVERHGGSFMHHDGGLQEGPARLCGLLEQADAVLCPLDCISHDAHARVKRFCKQRDKPVVMLRSAGLSSFAKGLTECFGIPISQPPL